MSERTWNQVNPRIYDEPLSEEAVLVAINLIVVCPNPYGVFGLPIGSMYRFYRKFFAPELIDAALDELAAYGEIKLYAGRSVVWIKKLYRRKCSYATTRNSSQEAFNFLSKYFPAVLEDFLALYPAASQPGQ